MVKNLPADTRDVSLIPGWVRSPGKENGNPLAWKTSKAGKLGGLIVIVQFHPSLCYMLYFISVTN